MLSALLYLNESSTDVSIVQLTKRPDGLIKEAKPPEKLESNKVTVLDVYGHLFYAGARTLERLLPRPNGAQNPVVILRLRGRTSLGATLMDILSDYAKELSGANGRLYLTGIGEEAYEQAIRTGKFRRSGPIRLYEATAIRGQSTNRAHADAESWLIGKSAEDIPAGEADSIDERPSDQLPS